MRPERGGEGKGREGREGGERREGGREEREGENRVIKVMTHQQLLIQGQQSYMYILQAGFQQYNIPQVYTPI